MHVTDYVAWWASLSLFCLCGASSLSGDRLTKVVFNATHIAKICGEILWQMIMTNNESKRMHDKVARLESWVVVS